MSEDALQQFYEFVLLPQFGIEKVNIQWLGHDAIGINDSAYHFLIGSDKYILIFRDHGEFSDEEIKEIFNLYAKSYEYVKPKSYSRSERVYSITFPTPYKYVKNVTGYFMLVRY